ncbi:MAG: hypothetical protein ACLUFT_12295 [Gemmiger formicilis]|uniref:hypothetical protein n=1 Tax=Gemmiger formicilis TaxID=745368 RepID=UPI003992601F
MEKTSTAAGTAHGCQRRAGRGTRQTVTSTGGAAMTQINRDLLQDGHEQLHQRHHNGNDQRQREGNDVSGW